MLLIGVFLGLGYTAPPFKLSYRGLGELTVGLTHSPYVILCGYIFQGGSWESPLPWLLCLPLFFATLGAITLAGIPDRLADQAVSKKVLAVIFGPRGAVILASFFVCIAAISGMLLWYFRIIQGIRGGMILFVIPHGLILLFVLFKLIQSRNYDRKIDGIMTLSLSYIIWFGIIPLLVFPAGTQIEMNWFWASILALLFLQGATWAAAKKENSPGGRKVEKYRYEAMPIGGEASQKRVDRDRID